MPPNPLDAFRNRLPNYLAEVHQANSEPAKAHAFLRFVRNTFEEIAADLPGRLVPDLEHRVKVRAGTVLVRGRIDALLGNLVIEFKMDLNDLRLEEARSQLQKYVAALWAIDGKRTNYMLMATDGLRFRVFTPSAPLTATQASPEEIVLDEVNLMNLETTEPENAFLWLDRYVLWRERIPPTAGDMARDFGPQSPAFSAAMDRLRVAWAKGLITATTPFEEWSKYLSVVYGSRVGDETLFLKHTYLATLAKLMVYTYYSSGAVPSKEEVRKVLNGQAFREWGIENFLEEDFFSWLVRGGALEEGLKLAWELLKILERYDLTRLTEDVLKGLYQELVDPEARHDLGEYYTPDWLAEWIVERLFDDPMTTALDPACGSGTFLATAIRRKAMSVKMEPHLRLAHILAAVKGIDVHPLAVLISKANYLMALGALVRFKAGRIHVPVYLANSIDFPTAKRDVEHGVEVYRYAVSDHASLVIPKQAVEEDMVAELIEAVMKFARAATEEAVKQDAAFFDRFVGQEVSGYKSLDGGARNALWDNCRTLTKLIRDNKDTIYAFIVKNVYRPDTMGKFGVVMGNPPWLSYRYVRLPDYQRKLKNMILREHRLLPPRKTELLTHMELATLFFARCCMNYLRGGGKIGFVMPRAVFTADQHDSFRRGDFLPRVGILEIADLEGVTPLFNVPTAVVIGKKGGVPGPPTTALRMIGALPEKNARLQTVRDLELEGKFTMELVPITFAEMGNRSAWAYGVEGPCGGRPLRAGPSPYMAKFREGATIVPRSAWWVEVKASAKLGVNPDEPFVETSQRSTETAKDVYRGLKISGNIERAYLYGSLLGSDVLPFVHLPIRPVVLPAEPSGDRYVIVKRDQVEARGHQGMARWLARVEKEWTKRRGAKAEKMNIYQRLDRGKGITNQRPRARFWVLYNASGTYLSACVVNTTRELAINANGQTIPLRGFVAESKTIYCATDDEEEAHYLAAMFNGTVVDTIIKPMQSRGLWGARDIMKKALEVGIPKFDRRNPAHLELATLARNCTATSQEVIQTFEQKKGSKLDRLSPQVVGRLRSRIREALSDELNQVDKLVCEVLAI